MTFKEDEKLVSLIIVPQGFTTTIFFSNLYKENLHEDDILMTLTKVVLIAFNP